MAVVAIHAVVDISPNAPVLGIGPGLDVAVGALEDGIVGRIRVTAGAHSPRATVIGREPGVIESCVQPTAGVVARGAGCREPHSNMVRIISALVIGLVTAV